MIGQMNEGADGLGDDPVSGLRYQQGTVHCLSPLGLGITAHQATLIQEFSHAKHR